MQSANMAQTWSAGTYETHARFVSDLAGDVMAWLDPKPGERILDVGCGDGVLTAGLAGRGVDVLGIDTSADLLRTAAARGLSVQAMDGQALNFVAEFDAVFSNAALHWMRDGVAVVDGVWRALKPRGRFVAEFGGHGNVAAIVTALRAVAKLRGGDQGLAGPCFFPRPQFTAKFLKPGASPSPASASFHAPLRSRPGWPNGSSCSANLSLNNSKMKRKMLLLKRSNCSALRSAMAMVTGRLTIFVCAPRR